MPLPMNLSDKTLFDPPSIKDEFEYLPKLLTEVQKESRLKATWQVLSGLVPNQALHTKEWYYTFDLYEQDKQTPQDQMTHFGRMMREAHEYAQQLTDPRVTNWVRVDFIWW